MRAEIITIGDELLIGQVIDTNSAWMAQRLNEHGILLHQITSVHDERQHILTAIHEAFKHADIVLTTGGLGPTKDDITKQVLCDYFNTILVEDRVVREHIHHLYQQRPEVLNRLTATQWLVPKTATILPNRVGSAPIMVFQQANKLLIAMPGMPHEMQVAMSEQVLPYIQRYCLENGISTTQIHHTSIRLRGIVESALAIRIEQWEDALPDNIHLAYLPKDGIITLRISAYGITEEEVKPYIDSLTPLIADYVLLS